MLQQWRWALTQAVPLAPGVGQVCSHLPALPGATGEEALPPPEPQHAQLPLDRSTLAMGLEGMWCDGRHRTRTCLVKMKTTTIRVFDSPKPPTAARMPGRPPTCTKSIFLHNSWRVRSGQGRRLQRALDTLCLWDPTAFNSYTVPSAAFLPDTHSSRFRSHS